MSLHFINVQGSLCEKNGSLSLDLHLTTSGQQLWIKKAHSLYGLTHLTNMIFKLPFLACSERIYYLLNNHVFRIKMTGPLHCRIN